MMRILSLVIGGVLLGTAGMATAGGEAQLGVDGLGNSWFLSPSGTVVVFAANGDISHNGTLIAKCTAGDDRVTVVNGVSVVCDDDEITLSSVGAGTEVFSRDDEDLSLITPTLILVKEIDELPLTPLPQGDVTVVIDTNATGTGNDNAVSVEIGTTAVQAESSVVRVAGCGIALGTYRYVFSDGIETYYYNGDTTIRVDADGSRVAVDGDFEVSAFGNTYSRTGDTFGFQNLNGSYSRVGAGQIIYSPNPALAATAALAPIGFSYSDEYGTYRKAAGGDIVFSPRLQLEDFVLTEADCASFQSAAFDYDEVLRTLNVVREGDQLRVNLDSDVLFEFDSAEVSPAAASALEQLAFLIQRDAKGDVIVAGHTDSKGTLSYNLTLSQRRAEAVKFWLTTRGDITTHSIRTFGHGEADPVARNTLADGSDNPQGRAQNRRVEIRFGT